MTTEDKLAKTQAQRDTLRAERDAAFQRAHDAEEERDRLRADLKEALARAEAAERGRDAAELARDELRLKLSTSATPCTGANCVSNDEHYRIVSECAALAAKLQAANDRANMLERDAADSRAKLETLSAFIRGGVSALVRG